MEWTKVYKGEEKIYIDEGIFFGKGVFETIAIYESPVMLKEHMDRVNLSLEKLAIDKFINSEEILHIIKEDNISYKALKLTITEKNNIISLREMSYNNESYENGFSLGISEGIRNSKGFTSFIKSTCYLDNIKIKEDGAKKGFNEMLLLNEEGKIAEGTMSNIFFIKGKKIHTPAVSCGILDGIMRKWVVNNFKVEEGQYTLEDIYNSDEIFLTNSLMGIMWVNKLGKTPIKKGLVTENIIKKYKIFLEHRGVKENDR